MTALNKRLKNILITQWQLINYAGSEIVTIELAEEFIRMGARVVIATHSYGYPIKKEFEKNDKIQVVPFDSVEFDKILNEINFDVVWVHHSLLPPQLLKKENRKTHFIYHHMSSFNPLEYPLLPEVEKKIASKILFNSAETAISINPKQVLFSKDMIEVFNNPAPDEFNDSVSQRDIVTPSNILVVSNHIPEEIRIAIEGLKKDNVNVTVFGSAEDVFQRVSAKTVQSADVIITIGKTVQYALLCGRPVYCYDRFGGPGYILENNYKKAEELNFSGRGFTKKTPEEILIEINKNYTIAAAFTKNNYKKFKKKYSLSARINRLMVELDKLSIKNTKILNSVNIVINYNKLIELFAADKQTANNYSVMLTAEINKNILLNKNLTDLNKNLTDLNKEILSIKDSRPYIYLIYLKNIKNKFISRH